MSWDDILADPEFQKQPARTKARVAVNYFNNEMVDDEFKALPIEKQKVIKARHIQTLMEPTPNPTLSAIGQTARNFPAAVAETAEAVAEGAYFGDEVRKLPGKAVEGILRASMKGAEMITSDPKRKASLAAAQGKLDEVDVAGLMTPEPLSKLLAGNDYSSVRTKDVPRKTFTQVKEDPSTWKDPLAGIRSGEKLYEQGPDVIEKEPTTFGKGAEFVGAFAPISRIGAGVNLGAKAIGLAAKSPRLAPVVARIAGWAGGGVAYDNTVKYVKESRLQTGEENLESAVIWGGIEAAASTGIWAVRFASNMKKAQSATGLSYREVADEVMNRVGETPGSTFIDTLKEYRSEAEYIQDMVRKNKVTAEAAKVELEKQKAQYFKEADAVLNNLSAPESILKYEAKPYIGEREIEILDNIAKAKTPERVEARTNAKAYIQDTDQLIQIPESFAEQQQKYLDLSKGQINLRDNRELIGEKFSIDSKGNPVVDLEKDEIRKQIFMPNENVIQKAGYEPTPIVGGEEIKQMRDAAQESMGKLKGTIPDETLTALNRLVENPAGTWTAEDVILYKELKRAIAGEKRGVAGGLEVSQSGLYTARTMEEATAGAAPIGGKVPKKAPRTQKTADKAIDMGAKPKTPLEELGSLIDDINIITTKGAKKAAEAPKIDVVGLFKDINTALGKRGSLPTGEKISPEVLAARERVYTQVEAIRKEASKAGVSVIKYLNNLGVTKEQLSNLLTIYNQEVKSRGMTRPDLGKIEGVKAQPSAPAKSVPPQADRLASAISISNDIKVTSYLDRADNKTKFAIIDATKKDVLSAGYATEKDAVAKAAQMAKVGKVAPPAPVSAPAPPSQGARFVERVGKDDRGRPIYEVYDNVENKRAGFFYKKERADDRVMELNKKVPAATPVQKAAPVAAKPQPSKPVPAVSGKETTGNGYENRSVKPETMYRSANKQEVDAFLSGSDLGREWHGNKTLAEKMGRKYIIEADKDARLFEEEIVSPNPAVAPETEFSVNRKSVSRIYDAETGETVYARGKGKPSIEQTAPKPLKENLVKGPRFTAAVGADEKGRKIYEIYDKEQGKRIAYFYQENKAVDKLTDLNTKVKSKGVKTTKAVAEQKPDRPMTIEDIPNMSYDDLLDVNKALRLQRNQITQEKADILALRSKNRSVGIERDEAIVAREKAVEAAQEEIRKVVEARDARTKELRDIRSKAVAAGEKVPAYAKASKEAIAARKANSKARKPPELEMKAGTMYEGNDFSFQITKVRDPYHVDIEYTSKSGEVITKKNITHATAQDTFGSLWMQEKQALRRTVKSIDEAPSIAQQTGEEVTAINSTLVDGDAVAADMVNGTVERRSNYTFRVTEEIGDKVRIEYKFHKGKEEWQDMIVSKETAANMRNKMRRYNTGEYLAKHGKRKVSQGELDKLSKELFDIPGAPKIIAEDFNRNQVLSPLNGIISGIRTDENGDLYFDPATAIAATLLHKRPDLMKMARRNATRGAINISKESQDAIDAIHKNNMDLRAHHAKTWGDRVNQHIEHWWDVQHGARSPLEKMKDSTLARRTVNRMNASLHSNAIATRAVDVSNEKIFKGLNSIEEDALDTMIFAESKKSIIEAHPERANDKIKGVSIQQIINTVDSGDLMISSGLSNEKWGELLLRRDEFFKTTDDLLKLSNKEGLTSDAGVEALAGRKYSPSRWVEMLDKVEDYIVGRKLSNKESGIKRLKEEIPDDLTADTRAKYLLQQHTVHVYDLVMKNQANKALYALLKEEPNNLIGRIAKSGPEIGFEESGAPKFEKPRHDEAMIYAMIDGQKQGMIVRKDFAEGWIKSDPQMTHELKSFVVLGSMQKVVKALATGYNVVFPLTNVPRDIAMVLGSPQYSNVVPWAAVQMAHDFAVTFRDAWGINRKRLWSKDESTTLRDFINEGGGSDLLTYYGRFKGEGHMGEQIDSVSKVIGYAGAGSEIWTRLAHRNRALKNLTTKFQKQNGGRLPDEFEKKLIQEEATEIACQGSIDFNQGGSWAKSLDAVIPYSNVSFQGIRTVARNVKKDPAGFAIKTAQLMGFSAFLYNNNKDHPGWADVTAREKEANFIVMLPVIPGVTTYTDEEGQTRYRYAKIAKEQALRSITTLTDTIYECIAERKMPDKNQLLQNLYAVGDLMPNVNPLNIPLVGALTGYFLNMDTYTWEKLWKSDYQKIDAGLEVNKSTGKTMEAIGKISSELPTPSISPVRLSGAISKVLPQNNPLTRTPDLISRLITGETAEEVGKKGWAAFLTENKDVGRVIGTTNPYQTAYKRGEEISKRVNTKDTIIKREFVDLANKYIDSRSEEDGDKMREYVNKFDKETQDKFRDTWKDMTKLKGIKDPYQYKVLLGMGPEARAIQIWDNMTKMKPEEQQKYYETLKGIKGILTEDAMRHLKGISQEYHQNRGE